MASETIQRSATNTLTGTTADTITFDQLWPAIEVTNHDATDTLYVLMNGTTTPVAVDGANQNTVILPGSTKLVRAVPVPNTRTIVLSIVGDGGVYTVEGVN